MTLREVAGELRAGRLSPPELLEATLGRIEDVDPALNAFIEVFAERARAAARAAEGEIAAGRYRGPLHGVPVAFKDVLALEGEVCAAASRILAGHVAARSSAVVERLLAAGAVPLGRLNMHEFAFGVTSENPHHGAVRAPWHPDRIAGGSSGGAAAAVAARLCHAAIGSDTGCSVRLPAAFSGCVGLRPSFGRVSRWGTVPLAPSLDTVGPLARTAEDAAIVLGAIAGHDPRDPASVERPPLGEVEPLGSGPERPRLGVLAPQATERLQPAVRGAFEAALRDLESAGATVEPVELGDLGPAVASLRTLNLAEPALDHAEWLRTRPGEYGEDVRARLEAGSELTAVQYLAAQRHRSRLGERLRPVLERFDALLTPSAPLVAPPLGTSSVSFDGSEEPLVGAVMRFNALPALTGLPAVSVVCGFDEEGLPVGLQIVARRFDDLGVLRLAHRYQEATDWHRRTPPLP